MLDALDVGVVVLDQQRQIRHWNAWMARASGLPPETVVARRFDTVFPPCGNTRLREAIEQALALGVPTTLTETLNGEVFPLRCPDGRKLRHNVLVSRYEDSSGPCCLIQVHDITARRAAETALRRSEDHYRHTVELNPQVPWTADAQGLIETFSKRWLTLTGQSPEEPLGDGWARVIHPEDLPAMLQAWTASVQTGAPYDTAHRVRLTDGSFRWMRSRAVPRRDGTGTILRWYGTTEDIHDRKLAEEASRRSEQRLRRAMETQTVGVIFFDPAGTIKEANTAFLTFSGFSREDVAAGRLN
ncbi:PAS domain-containing protein [Azospirillum canadense]|uniref:PAS domain-containing protein n=1 Tax=Azospirillum canadense TaxID=403962 RepID=UPI002225D948|nr:PAS domain S-box protein [Azospirillum canadense]MCW2239602.1 PAS domain S-box-containing protein [Azospirillum canadense]